MIVTVPIKYIIQVRHNRASKDKAHTVWRNADVVLEQISSAEAPVALRWKLGQILREEPVDIRYYDGKLWQPMLTGDESDHNGKPLPLDDLLERVAKASKSLPNPLLVGQEGAWDNERPTHIDIPNVKTITVDPYQELVAQLQAKAAKVIIIDGVPHVPSVEPVYYYQLSTSLTVRDSSYWFIDAIPVTHLQDPKKFIKTNAVYRADRLDEILEILSKDRRQKDHLIQHIEVLMPEVLRYDDEEPLIKAAAEEALNNLESVLRDASVDFFIAYAQLRDLVKAKAPVDPDLVGAMTHLLDQCHLSPNPADQEYVGRLQRALKRWEARPLALTMAENTPKLSM